MYKQVARPLLFHINPERVHKLLMSQLGIYHYLSPIRAYVRSTHNISDPFTFKNLHFKNRIGLSAGFDKSAEAFDELADFGFGFLELGTITPDAQSGNPTPRIFRVVDDESLISRTGFNNLGADVVHDRIEKKRKHSYVLGANINKNPLSTGEQIIADFVHIFTELYEEVDYFTLNWGSIDAASFAKVLEKLTIIRQSANKQRCIFIKIPCDVDKDGIDKIIDLANKYAIDGFIATGPTMDRSQLVNTPTESIENMGAGGVSGKGIGAKSRKVVSYLSTQNADHKFLIIGAGGIMNEKDAADMIACGADLIQIYSAFIYSGPDIVYKIGKKLKSN